MNKLHLRQPFPELIPQQIKQNGFFTLDIKQHHLNELINLPFHHRDPFDRILISQSIVYNMPILSADDEFDLYDVKRIW